MCGLYGAIGTSGSQAWEVTQLAGTRGPHAWGYWLNGEVKHYLTKIPDYPHHPLSWPSSISVLIGHARLNTTGCFLNPAASQPLEAQGLWLTHNGTVPDYPMHAISDSAWLAQEIRQASGTLAQRLNAVLLTHLPDTHPYAIVIWNEVEIVLQRRRLPLWIEQKEAQWRWCSRKFGEARALEEDRPLTINWPQKGA